MDVDRVDPQELIDIKASLDTWIQTGELDEVAYQQLKSQITTPLQAEYLFSLPGWDVLELLDEPTVETFSPELSHFKLNITLDKSEKHHPIPHENPVGLRYLLLTPEENDEQDGRRLLMVPFLDNAIVVAMVLVDDQVYIPAGAIYMGKLAEHHDQINAMHAIYEAADGLTLDLDMSKIIPAPELPPELIRLINRLDDHPFGPEEKRNILFHVSSLDDEQFIEAVVRISVNASETNRWIQNEPTIGTRNFELMYRKYPKLKKQIRMAPYKSAIMRPLPYKPEVIFRSFGGRETWSRPKTNKQALSDMRQS